MNDLQKFIDDYFKPLANRFKVLEDENKALKNRVDELEKKNNTNGTSTKFTFSSLFDNEKKDECSKAMISMVKKDLKIQETKENNIIIGGVPKPTIIENKIDLIKDNELIASIFNHLTINPNTIKFDSQRIRKDDVINDKNNPILIKFKDLKDKLSVLKNANKLKSFNGPKIFINHDLTDSDRDFEKALRDERKKRNDALSYTDPITNLKYGLDDNKKFYYGVRRGSIKKIFI
jgi:hypothetical protein